MFLCPVQDVAWAQWVQYPTPGTPRTKNGAPNLTARTPRTRTVRPDLSGVWYAADAGPTIDMTQLPQDLMPDAMKAAGFSGAARCLGG
ncbi:MAG: hypothetical protein WDM77_10560 [Steroidobacteraceae bacterium]